MKKSKSNVSVELNTGTELSREAKFKLIDYEARKVMGQKEPAVLNALQKLLSSTTRSLKAMETVRQLLGLPNDFDVNEFGSKTEFPIPFATKVRLMNFVLDLSTGFGPGVNLHMVFRIDTKTIKSLLNSDAAKVALLVDDYFVRRTLSMPSLRKGLKEIFNTSFDKKGLATLDDAAKKKITYIMLRKMSVTPIQMQKMFGGSEYAAIIGTFYPALRGVFLL